jgi:hypothetical protein
VYRLGDFLFIYKFMALQISLVFPRPLPAEAKIPFWICQENRHTGTEKQERTNLVTGNLITN